MPKLAEDLNPQIHIYRDHWYIHLAHTCLNNIDKIYIPPYTISMSDSVIVEVLILSCFWTNCFDTGKTYFECN